jgi:hypothetical protein
LAGSLVAVATLCGTAHGAFIDGTLVQSSKLKLKSIDRSVPGNVGGTVRCPPQKTALTGGAFWHQTGVGPDPAISNLVSLTSSYPVGERKWYADGRNSAANPRTLTIEVRCLPARKLKAAVTRTNSKILDSGTAGQVRAGCPNGYEEFTGGSYLAEPGGKPKPGVGPKRGRITGSYPDNDEWRAVGGNFSEGKLALTAVVRCFPTDSVDGSANYDYPTVPDNSTGGGYVSCGAGSATLTGGVYWKPLASNEPDPELASSTYLSANAPTTDVNGFYTAGLNASGGSLQLAIINACPSL